MTEQERNAVTNAVTNGRTNAVSNGAQTSTEVVLSNERTTEDPSPSSPTFDALEEAARAEVEAEHAAVRLETFLGRRPARFAVPGELHPDVLAWARRHAGGDAGNLVLTGNTGTGKSWTAWRTGEELLRHGYRGRIEIATAYRLKQLATPPVDTAELARLASADLLALDDIGAIRVSDWDADHLYALVDERWAHKRPTIVIANATAPREDGKTLLQGVLGDRVASRVADGVTVVIMGGSDRRRQP